MPRRRRLAVNEGCITRLGVFNGDDLAAAELGADAQDIARSGLLAGGQRRCFDPDRLEAAPAITEHDLGADVGLVGGHLDVQIAIAAARAARGGEQQRGAGALILPAQLDG